MENQIIRDCATTLEDCSIHHQINVHNYTMKLEDLYHSTRLDKQCGQLMADVLPMYFNELQKVREFGKEYLRNNKGFFISKIEGISLLSDIGKKCFVLGYAGMMGKIYGIEHIQHKESSIKPSYSTMMGGCDLKTYHSFFPTPPRFIGITSGGKNSVTVQLVDGRKIIHDIAVGIYGEKLSNELFTLQFPFRVPNNLTRSGDKKSIEIYNTSILSPNSVQFEYDKIIQSLHISGTLMSDTSLELLEKFHSIIHEPSRILEIELDKDSIIFLNNQFVLHNVIGGDYGLSAIE